jgi:predicted acetyltransferase
MKLRSLQITDESAALSAHEELAQENFSFLFDYTPGMPWSDYLNSLENLKKGETLPPDRVRADFLIAEDDGELMGRTSIRYELNDFLFQRGGHIGYAVRPAFRNRGFAKQILKQSLELISEAGVKKVLITCNDSNHYSARVIESSGGVLENAIEHDGVLIRRYWIDLI